MTMTKTYRQLTEEEKIKTYEEYQALCKLHREMVPFADFAEYDAEQKWLDLDFDADTLECLG